MSDLGATVAGGAVAGGVMVLAYYVYRVLRRSECAARFGCCRMDVPAEEGQRALEEFIARLVARSRDQNPKSAVKSRLSFDSRKSTYSRHFYLVFNRFPLIPYNIPPSPHFPEMPKADNGRLDSLP